jgi:hypothetical protein
MNPKNKSALKGKDPELAISARAKLLIFGPPGIGKTFGSLSFPNCYFIDTEGGANLPHYTARLKIGGGVYCGPEDGSLDFEFVIGQLSALATEQHPFKTVVIDSVSKIYNSAILAEAERLGSKNAFGADKKPAIRFMQRLVQWVNRLDMNVIFIAHQRSEWGIDSTGSRSEIGKTADVWDKLEYELNLSLQIVRDGNGRVGIVRKSRLEGFQINQAVKWEFEDFQRLYCSTLTETVKIQKLITVEQLNQIGVLFELLKVDPEAIDKLFAKAGVSQLSELTFEQGQKLILFYENKFATRNSKE